MTRESIERTLRMLNEAENSTTLTPAEKCEIIDGLTAPDARGWANGVDRGDRAAEREFETAWFERVPDYRRVFERMIIDPPHAAIAWHMTGTITEMGTPLDLPGATILRFDDDSRIQEFWLYFDDPATTSVVAD